MIQIKNKRVFLNIKGHWLNLNLQISAAGGGFKGTWYTFKGIVKCLFNRHTDIHVAQSRPGYVIRKVQCAYCRRDNEFYEGRARRDNMSSPGDKDYEI